MLDFSTKNPQHTTTPLHLILLVFCLLPGDREIYDGGALVGEGNKGGSSLSFHLPSARRDKKKVGNDSNTILSNICNLNFFQVDV